MKKLLLGLALLSSFTLAHAAEEKPMLTVECASVMTSDHPVTLGKVDYRKVMIDLYPMKAVIDGKTYNFITGDKDNTFHNFYFADGNIGGFVMQKVNGNSTDDNQFSVMLNTYIGKPVLYSNTDPRIPDDIYKRIQKSVLISSCHKPGTWYWSKKK